MKLLLRNVLLNALALSALPYLFPGVIISGGAYTYVFAGFLLTLMSFIIKPILNLITLPINLMTFGLFSIVTNTFILYLLTVLMTNISIHPFVLKGFSYNGFAAPTIAITAFFAYFISAIVLSLITSFINWLTK